jgi:hypothetical protein
MASFPGVDFQSDPAEWTERVITGQVPSFKYGTFYSDEIGLFGNVAYAAGNCTYVIEESALVFRRNEVLEDWANRAIFLGRHVRLNLLLVAQRASKIPIDIRSQANRVITFCQTEPDDVAAVSERIGRDWREEIPKLPPLTCLDWSGGTVKKYAIRPG